MPGLSVAAEYYRIDFKNITVRQNSLLNADSYNQFNVVSPLDGSVIPAYVIKPEFRGQVANVDSTSDEMKRNYNGLDINFNARMPRRRPRLRRLQPRALAQQHLCGGRERSEQVALLRSVRRAASRGRSSSRARSCIRCRGMASR